MLKVFQFGCIKVKIFYIEVGHLYLANIDSTNIPYRVCSVVFCFNLRTIPIIDNMIIPTKESDKGPCILGFRSSYFIYRKILTWDLN